MVCATGAELTGAISNRAVKTIRIKPTEESGTKFLASLRKIIRYEKPQILHIHSRPGDGWAALAGRLEKKPIVYSLRTDEPPGLLDKLFKYRLFSQIITLSQGINRVLRDASIGLDNTVCIPGAVDLQRFQPKQEGRDVFLSQTKLRGDGPVLAVFAQLIQRKGHSVLFGALPAVLAKYPTARLLVFGRGALKDELPREVTRRGLEKFVRFQGYEPALENFLPFIDIIVHPALTEGMGGVLMEAAACGVPIVASRVGGIPEVVKDRFNGYLVSPGDSKTLARHILELLDDQEQRHQFGRTGREQAVDAFAIERVVAQHRGIYRNL